MANSSIDPGKREDDLDDPAGRTSEPREGALVAAGRDDLVDPDAPRQTLVAAGRDDLVDEPGRRDPLDDRAVPVLDENPIAPGGREPPDDVRPDDGDEHGRSVASTALMLLIAVLVIFGLSLWLVPNVAPHLPAHEMDRVQEQMRRMSYGQAPDVEGISDTPRAVPG